MLISLFLSLSLSFSRLNFFDRNRWGAVPKDSGAWGTSPAPSSSSSSVLLPRKAPLFVLGSDAWNSPNAEGQIACGGEAQEKVLGAFSSSGNGGNGSGSGALFAVLKGSSHAGFSDVVSLLPGLSKWFYGRRRKAAATEEAEEENSGVVTETSDPVSTARAAAEMAAAFLLRRRGGAEGAGGEGGVTEEDGEAVAAAAASVGVELRGLRVV